MHMMSPVKYKKKLKGNNIKCMYLKCMYVVFHLMNNYLFEGENVKLIINWPTWLLILLFFLMFYLVVVVVFSQT